MSRQAGQYSPAPAAASFAAAGEGGDLGTVEARIMARVQAICSPTRKTRVSQLMKVGFVATALLFAACAVVSCLWPMSSMSQSTKVYGFGAACSKLMPFYCRGMLLPRQRGQCLPQQAAAGHL